MVPPRPYISCEPDGYGNLRWTVARVMLTHSGTSCVAKRTPTVATPNHQCSLSDSPQSQLISNGARARVCYGNPRRWGAWSYACNNGYTRIGSICLPKSTSTPTSPIHQCSLSGAPQTEVISNGARARVCYGNPRRWTAWSYACSNGYVQSGSGSSCVRSSVAPVTPGPIQCNSGDDEVEQITDGERTRTCRPNDSTWTDWTYQCDSGFYDHHGICRFGAEPNFCPILRVLPDRVPAEAGGVDSH